MLRDFSKDFTAKDTSFINLNNGTLGLCPDSVIRAQMASIESFEHNTSHSLGSSWARLWKIQQDLAAFLNTNAEELFLRPNVTLVLNEMILGLTLPKNSEILTSNFEYGAVLNILKHKAEKEDHALRLMDMSYLMTDVTEDQVVERIVSELRPQTKLILLCHIFTGNGIKLPIEKIGRALRERDVYFIIDGAHGPGCLSLQISKSFENIDFYGGNLHKWMMGPKGTAFGWVHPRLHDKTSPLFASWTFFDDPPEPMKSFKPGSFASRMLWSHSQDFSAYYALEACLHYWDSYSAHVIQEEILKRSLFLEEELLKHGLKPLKSVKENLGSSLLCYEKKNFRNELFQGLFIQVPNHPPLQVGLPRIPGYEALRLTPHIHNTKSELEQAVKILIAARVV